MHVQRQLNPNLIEFFFFFFKKKKKNTEKQNQLTWTHKRASSSYAGKMNFFINIISSALDIIPTVDNLRLAVNILINPTGASRVLPGIIIIIGNPTTGV